MNLPLCRILAPFVAASFALAGCGEVDETDTGTDELTEQAPSTETPPSTAEPERAPNIEVGTPDLNLGKSRTDPTDNKPPTRELPQ